MVLKEGDYLKFDIGVYVDGYIVDIVVIFRVGMEEDEFMEVVREVFENVIVMVRVGVMIRDVVRVIEEIIWGKGFNLIVNLSGYKVECYKFYVGVSVFNVYREVDIYVFQEGDVFVIEFFVIIGVGQVIEVLFVFIFMYFCDRFVRMFQVRRFLMYIKKNYKILFFVYCWFQDFLFEGQFKFVLVQFEKVGVIYVYLIFREVWGGMVVQFEYIVIVEKEGVYIII